VHRGVGVTGPHLTHFASRDGSFVSETRASETVTRQVAIQRYELSLATPIIIPSEPQRRALRRATLELKSSALKERDGFDGIDRSNDEARKFQEAIFIRYRRR